MPATNPKAAALARLLSTDAGYTYGNVLPLAKNNETGAISPAVPNVVRSAARGVADLVNMRTAPSAQPGVNTLTPDSLGALMGMPAAGVAPAGAVATGAIRRAALPMDEASRMARAAEQGFTTPAFHGSPKDLTELTRLHGIRSAKFDQTGEARGIGSLGTWLSSRGDDAGASMYAMQYGKEPRGAVYPVNARLKNPLVIQGSGTKGIDGTDDAFRQLYSIIDEMAPGQSAGVANRNMEPVRERLKQLGYDGIVLRNTVGDAATPQDMSIVFDDGNIRSRFAAFDPAKKDSTDLLASRSPGYPLAGQQQDVPDRKKLARALSKVQK